MPEKHEVLLFTHRPEFTNHMSPRRARKPEPPAIASAPRRPGCLLPWGLLRLGSPGPDGHWEPHTRRRAAPWLRILGFVSPLLSVRPTGSSAEDSAWPAGACPLHDASEIIPQFPPVGSSLRTGFGSFSNTLHRLLQRNLLYD